MKKKRLSKVIIILVIIAGLSLMLYPTVSNYVNSYGYHKAIRDYNDKVTELDEDNYASVLEQARAYNAALAQGGGALTTLNDEKRRLYESLLDITGTGIMGYIDIPVIDVSLPIYHGTDDAVLQSGVGHIEGSSLPIGGESTYTILSGHRGLPSARLFTDIDQLKVKDTFAIHVLNEMMTYEVDDIKTVLPEEVGNIRIEAGKDYCTLMTCTPYGVNTHRLLVRGHRIENPPEDEQSEQQNAVLGKHKLEWYIYLIVPVAVIIIILLVSIIAIRKRKNKG